MITAGISNEMLLVIQGVILMLMSIPELYNIVARKVRVAV